MKTQKDVFAIQDGGKCLVSSTRDPAFNKYGISQDCKSDGKGASGASHVYLTFGIEGTYGMEQLRLYNFVFSDSRVLAFSSTETTYKDMPVTILNKRYVRSGFPS